MDHLSPAARSQHMAKIRGKNTRPEMIVRSTLHSLGYRYRLHDKRLPGCPDLVFPSRKKVIFVNGCFWHGHACRRGQSIPKSNCEFWSSKIQSNKLRDQRNEKSLLSLGWTLMIVWECQVKSGNWIAEAQAFLEDVC
jgi:DNA mismatch endonuclease (patch repair protein)